VSDWPTPTSPSAPPIAELSGLANALRVLLLLAAVLSAALAYLAVRMRAALDAVAPDAANPQAAAGSEVDAFFGGASIYFLALAGIGVLFVVWLWRAAKNNRAFGRPGALAPGWAIGSWFIPLGSLVIPGVMVQQLWKGADSTVPRGDPGWRRAPANAQIWFWWVAYVAAQGLTFVGFTLAGQSDDPQGDITVADLLSRIDDVHLGVTLFVAGQLLMIVAAALGAAMVVGLSRHQAEAAALLGSTGADGASAWLAASRPSSPPAWHRDPTGRYDLRYWDGHLWTEHVTRDGNQTTDPV
jgi:hypothetical protein